MNRKFNRLQTTASFSTLLIPAAATLPIFKLQIIAALVMGASEKVLSADNLRQVSNVEVMPDVCPLSDKPGVTMTCGKNNGR